MGLRLADRLHAARQRLYVGRTGERELFEAAITAPSLPFQILLLYGPGGIGKTALLDQFQALCKHHGVPYTYIDGRYLDPNPDSFRAAIEKSFRETGRFAGIGETSDREIFFFDTYEKLAPLDIWFREDFLPQLSEETLVVLSGRLTPSPVWRTDPGWRSLVRFVPLTHLTREETIDYLQRRNVPDDLQDRLRLFTQGHPLALALVADVYEQRPDWNFHPEKTPDVVRVLLERFVEKVPSPAHRAALETCALVRYTTEDILERCLDRTQTHDFFEWLRDLSFIESGPYGLFPNDMARTALASDLRWRNPEWFSELHQRARAHYALRLQQTRGQELQRVISDYIFLHRENPFMRPFFEWQESGGSMPRESSRENWPFVRKIIERFEGEISANLASYWFEQRPACFQVFYESDPTPSGLLCLISWKGDTPIDSEADPGVQSAWNYLRTHAPLRTGESATIFRFWMGAESYQDVSAVQSLIFIQIARHYFTTPGLAFTFFPCANPEFWAPFCGYIDLHRIPEAEFTIDGRHYGVYGHDWRTRPPADWLALMAEREIATEPLQAEQVARQPLVVLGEDEFGAAVRDALKHYVRPNLILPNPLLKCRFVVTSSGAGADDITRLETLRRLFLEAAHSLKTNPRNERFYHVLNRTFFHPAPSQEQAAELLKLPFSTYRRYLARGIQHIIEQLWQKELGSPGPR